MNKFDLTGYVSPIQRIAKAVQARIEEHEGQILMKAVHDVGFDVNMHELMKALAYDRQQYQKGYADAMKNAVPLDKLCEWLGKFANPCKIGIRCHYPDDCMPTVECWRYVLTKWMEEQNEPE